MTDHRTLCAAAMDSAKKHKRMIPPDGNWQAELLKAVEVWMRWTLVGVGLFTLIYNLFR